MKFREKILIIIASFALVTAAIVIFLILPSATTIVEIKDQIEDQRIIYEISKRRSDNLISFQKDIEEIQTQNENLKSMFINESNQLSFFRDLENIAQTHSLNLDYSLEDLSKKTQSPKEVMVNINIEGKYNNILKFLTGLESLNYYIKPISLVFRSTSSQNTQVTIQSQSYWQ